MWKRHGRKKHQPATFVFPEDSGDGYVDEPDIVVSNAQGTPVIGASPIVTTVSDGENDNGNSLERTTVRIDGLEVYAVVSALTSATSIQCFEAFNVKGFIILWRTQQYIELVCDSLFFLAGTTGILAGLHSTLIFSLMTMYGRTAVGMNRDDVLETFFQRTQVQRMRGFRSFLHSMYAFLIQVTFLITSKCPEEARAFAFLFTSFAISMTYRDTQSVIEAASIIYIPKERTRHHHRRHVSRSQSNRTRVPLSPQKSSHRIHSMDR